MRGMIVLSRAVKGDFGGGRRGGRCGAELICRVFASDVAFKGGNRRRGRPSGQTERADGERPARGREAK